MLNRTCNSVPSDDNTVEEIRAYTDGVENNDVLSPGRQCDVPFSNLTVVGNIDIQIQQVMFNRLITLLVLLVYEIYPNSISSPLY